MGALVLGAGHLAAQTPAPRTVATAPASDAPGPSKAQRTAARDAYLAGARALAANDLTSARAHFDRAAELDPAEADYHIGQRLALEHQVTQLVQDADKLRRSGDTARSDALLAQAHALDPENRIAAQHIAAQPAPHLAASSRPLPGSATVPETPDATPEETAQIGGELHILATSGRRNLHARGDIRSVLTQVLTSYGVRAAFDDSVSPQPVRFDLDDVTFAQAVPVLLQIGRLYAVPLDPHTVLISKDNADLRTRLERQLEETIYVPGVGTEQINELGNVLRNVFDIRQISVQSTSSKIVVRAPAETMHGVNTILSDLIDGGSEVLLDVRLYMVDKTRTRQIGPSLPQQFGVYNVASTARSLVTANQSLVDQAIAQGLITLTGNTSTDLLREAVFLIASGAVQSSLLTNTLGFFGGGIGLTGVTAGPAAFNFALNSSDTRELDNVQLRASDRQAATFRSGTRYPITTSTLSTGTSALSSSSLAGVTINGVSASSLLNQFLGTNSGATIPQIQYEDLGVTLKATPVVQRSGDVGMRLDLKIEALAGTALNNIPILASRQFVSDITVADGDTALMVSTMNRQESTAVSGLPGLGELPGFQTATADRTSQFDVNELVLLITPHIVRHRPNALAGPRIAINTAPEQRE